METPSKAGGANRQTGTVVKWLNHRGIGFIAPNGQTSEIGRDILVHHAHIQQESGDGFKSLQEGSIVEFDTMPDPKHPDKFVAVRVTGPGGVDCEKRRSRYRPFDETEANPDLQVWVGNLTADTTWRHLKDHFRPCGTIARADVIQKKEDNLYYGVVSFKNVQDAQAAVERMNGVTLHGQPLQVKPYDSHNQTA